MRPERAQAVERLLDQARLLEGAVFDPAVVVRGRLAAARRWWALVEQAARVAAPGRHHHEQWQGHPRLAAVDRSGLATAVVHVALIFGGLDGQPSYGIDLDQPVPAPRNPEPPAGWTPPDTVRPGA